MIYKKPSNTTTSNKHLKESSEISNLSFSSITSTSFKLSEEEQQQQQQSKIKENNQYADDDNNYIHSKCRILSLFIKSIFHKRIENIFYQIKTKPLYQYKVKERLVQVLVSVYKRNDYEMKFIGFGKIRKQAIQQKKEEIKHLNEIMKKMQQSSAKVLAIFLKTKRLSHLSKAFQKISQNAEAKYINQRRVQRKGIRLINQAIHKAMKRSFHHLRDSYFMKNRRENCFTLFKVLKEVRLRCMKKGFSRLRTNQFKERELEVKEEVKKIESTFAGDSEIESELIQKQAEMEEQIAELKLEKEQLEHEHEQEVNEASMKNEEIEHSVQELQEKKKTLQDEIVQLDERLKEPYTLAEIFQIFYNNLLMYIVKQNSKQKPLLKSEMIEAIKQPLVPLHIPMEKLKEENEVMKELIKEYVLIYGQKTLENVEIEVPFEYLVQENFAMHQMLIVMLERISYDKKDTQSMKEVLSSVEKVVKEFGPAGGEAKGASATGVKELVSAEPPVSTSSPYKYKKKK